MKTLVIGSKHVFLDRMRPDEAAVLEVAGERVPMEVAIDAYTRGGAMVTGRSDELGTLAPGMLADLAVIDCNLMAPTSIEEILGARELATYVGGQLVWEV